MKLRTRLSVTIIAVVIPMIAGLLWFDARARHRAAEQALADFTLDHMQQGGRDRCEAGPAGWGGRVERRRRGDEKEREPRKRPPLRGGALPVLYAYNDNLRSENPDAPLFTTVAAEALRREREITVVAGAATSERVEILVRMPWRSGPCSYVRALGSTVPGWLGAILPASEVWMAPLLAVFAAMLLAVGPIVRRVRRLTLAVESTAKVGYARPVTIDGKDEIADLARAFDAAGQEIRAQLADKDRRESALREFLANTTHDMMIPLTVLQGHLVALQERAAAGELVDPAVLVSAMDEAHYMASLLHNLAVAAKLDAAEPELSRGAVDLNALVARVVGRHRPIARRLDVALECSVPDPPLVAEADVTLFEQAVSNVVYNAIRHNRPGGHVAVILERVGGAGGASGRAKTSSDLTVAAVADADAPSSRFRLRVIDDGPGIPEDQLSRLVERGFRGDDARSRSPDGQGLGLNITYRVAQLHGLKLRLGPSEYGGLQVDLAS